MRYKKNYHNQFLINICRSFFLIYKLFVELIHDLNKYFCLFQEKDKNRIHCFRDSNSTLPSNNSFKAL